MTNSKILPVEAEIISIAKSVLSENNACYCRKYSQALVRNKVPTGKRSHKFFGVFSKTNSTFDLVCKIDQAIQAVSNEYYAYTVYSPFHNYPSITIRPIR